MFKKIKEFLLEQSVFIIYFIIFGIVLTYFFLHEDKFTFWNIAGIIVSSVFLAMIIVYSLIMVSIWIWAILNGIGLKKSLPYVYALIVLLSIAGVYYQFTKPQITKTNTVTNVQTQKNHPPPKQNYPPPVKHYKKPDKKQPLKEVYRVGAICNDGSRSYATGRGACSHHGGVDYWLLSDGGIE